MYRSETAGKVWAFSYDLHDAR